ncbi:MAG TPA: SMC-Scp complex subunit ScpB [Polyangia bacterium]|nr:SMC-Scp complex subunit ScpB [Polyangia bacterium]
MKKHKGPKAAPATDAAAKPSEPDPGEADPGEADPSEEPTNPNHGATAEALGETLADSEFDDEDTAVTAAPVELLRSAVRPDDWDGPTTEAAAAELAALAAASTEAGGDADAQAELPVSAPGHLESVLESLLFASDRPLTVNELKKLVGERAGGKVSDALEALRARRDLESSGIQVIEVAGGWHLRTRSDNQAWVSRLVAGRPQRLTRAMLETLSIVAYRQPITRPEIDDVRGVDCGPVLKTLLDRGLVRMIGKKEEVGRPILYGTTPEFLRIFSLKDLAELPTLREFHELNADDMAKVDAAAPLAADAKAEASKPVPTAPRELDPEEDDELLTELERAAASAARAADATEVTTAPPPAAEETPPQQTTE